MYIKLVFQYIAPIFKLSQNMFHIHIIFV